jgi:hypothetical protein
MKAAFLLLSAICAQGGTLNINQGGIKPQGFTGTVQIFASNDLKLWQPKYEVAAEGSVPLPKEKLREFYRARPKPSPAIVSVTSAQTSTGCLYTISGTSTVVLVDLMGGLYGAITNAGHISNRTTLTEVEWEFPPIKLPIGSNTLSLFFRDVNNNVITTNFNVLILPGPPVSIEYPLRESLVCGESGVLIGRVDDLQATVTVNDIAVSVCEDGRFYAVGLPIKATNVWVVRSGTNEASVTFYKSAVTLTYTLSTSASPHMPLPFLVNGFVSDTNVTLRIGERTVKPDASGAWHYRGNPPRKGILPITIIPTNGTQSSSAISASMSADWYITAHSLFHRYDTHTALFESWKQYAGYLSKGDVTYSMLKYNYYRNKELCSTTYAGFWPYLLIDTDEGDCPSPTWRIYPAQAEISTYSDSFETDSLIHSANSVVSFYTGGNPGGARTLHIALTLYATKVWRDNSDYGDEMMGESTADLSVIGYVGGSPLNSDGVVYINAPEGTYVDVTPTLTAMNSVWFQYEFDWREID